MVPAEACCAIESSPELGDDGASIQSSILVMNERLTRLQSITGRIEAKLKAFGSSAADVNDGSRSSKFYEKLFGGILTHHHLWWLFVLAINSALVAFVFAGGHSRAAERGDLATTFALMNLVATIGIRDGTFLLLLYKLVVRVPWQKYFFNRMLHCNGGIHTGCAMMLLLWTILSLCMSIATNKGDTFDLTMLSLLCIGLFLMMLLAVPAVRERHHNVFERVHRYLGWSLLLLLTAILVKTLNPRWRSAQAIVDSVLMLISLILVFYSWFLIQRQRVEIYVGEQGNIVVVRLQGRARAGSFARISLNLVEWHSFSVAFSDRQSRSYGLIVGVAGDWTKRLAQKCIHNNINMNTGQVVDEFFSAEMDLEDPKAAAAHHQKRTISAWIRWHRPLGFMYSLYAYKRVICVGTGAGIAPILPHIGNQSTQMHVVWIAKNHRKIYGEEICSKVFQHPNHTIYDTAKQGRPQPEIALLPFEEFRAEAIFVVSNALFTEAVRAICRKKKIPAFGALFDS